MNKLKTFFLGKPKDPMAGDTHRKMALTILFAWIGLGADGISSSCYGPEQAFLALGPHHFFALWVAIALFVTVFIIAFAYNRVIVLFPNGGGGYKVATRLLGRYAGLISGIALILDYILTIVISVTTGIQAVFSIFGITSTAAVQICGTAIILLITYLNVRGVKESIAVMLPIFIGFVILHALLIAYGIGLHLDHFNVVVHNAQQDTVASWHQFGMLFVMVAFMHSYAQGGATYTGLEAVSNNVNILAEPRVKTGKWVMLLMALSLGIIAGGILLLYLLWQVHPVPGETLNAVVFYSIAGNTFWGHIIVTITLLLEGGLLFIAANTGFLGGPAVLANMAVDQWIPRSFVNVSDRLVKQNGIILMCIVSLIILFVTDGNVRTLVVIYSLSVFLAFSIAIIGLIKYYLIDNKSIWQKIKNFIPLLVGAIICVVIFFIVLVTNIWQGSLLGIVMIGILLAGCLYIKKNYQINDKLIAKLDKQLTFSLKNPNKPPMEIQPFEPTAVIFVGDSVGAAMHTLLAVKRQFGGHYVNVIFIDVDIIDSFSMVGRNNIKQLELKAKENIDYLAAFCRDHSIPVQTYCELTTDYLDKIREIIKKITGTYKNCTFFASQLVFPGNDWVQKLIYNRVITPIQFELYSMGLNMMVLPVRVVYSEKDFKDE
ncbi:MAG: APC family permease [Gammaproteobacteria bacterium]|nr:APC family permease [Gammaproteobacteria bacterium]